MKFYSAGESHGPQLTIIVEGLPSGLAVSVKSINAELKRRQAGYGRGGRMAIESDEVSMVGGVRWGKTTGAPVAMVIKNRDWANWTRGMSADSADAGSIDALTKVRPGHADLSGAMKYRLDDARNVLERSSARETASRVAVGAVAKALLEAFGVSVGSFVDNIGGASLKFGMDFERLGEAAKASPVMIPDQETSAKAMEIIDQAKARGDTIGGSFVVFALGLPVGLGGHTSWAERIEGKIGRAVLSIPAIKAVEFGVGFEVANLPGSLVHDEIMRHAGSVRSGGVKRSTNRAGGIEGGMTNGEALWLRAAMKPIPTLMKPLNTVDMVTGQPLTASTERSDVCAVSAASVVGEAMVAIELASALKEKTGGDSVAEMKRNFDSYLEDLGSRWPRI